METISNDCLQRFKAINDVKDILSGKWKIMIIASLSVFGEKRYTELQRIIDGIGTKMLSKELQELEINGLIKRTVMATKPVKYELTAYGSTLKPIIDEMASWGGQHRAKVIKDIAAK